MSKVYGFTGNPRSAAIRVVAEYEGINLEYVEVDIFNKDSLSADFTSKFPLQKIPALEHNGVNVTETLAVAAYLASQNDSKNLFGKTKEEKAAVLQWASFANSLLLPTLAEWFLPITKGPFNKKASEDGKAASAKLYAHLDKYLADKTFLVGERITFADILTATVLQRGSDHVVDNAFISQCPNLLRFFNTVLRQPEVVKISGEPKIIEKPKEYVPIAKEKKEKAPAAAPAPKAPKAEKKPAPKEDDDDDEPSVPAEPKAKHPCEALGKPTFVLDDWKRKYSNSETPEAMKWFEENFKPDEYSLYLVDYKFPEDLTQVFMSSNLIGGFHTRLEGSRKYLFGSACVYGTNNDSKIRGVYLCRGQEWKPVFEVGPDYESYEFKKLDYSKPEDKELVNSNWAWEDKVDGKAAADGKVFK